MIHDKNIEIVTSKASVFDEKLFEAKFKQKMWNFQMMKFSNFPHYEMKFSFWIKFCLHRASLLVQTEERKKNLMQRNEWIHVDFVI